MEKDTIFIEFIEHNDWEGETWSFFFESELDAFKRLKELINGDDTYEVSTKISKEKAIILVENTESGYMDRWNMITGVLKASRLPIDRSYALFYKGGILDYLTY